MPDLFPSAMGLHAAMYVVPIVCIPLVAVLFAASQTVEKDYVRRHGAIVDEIDETT